MLSSRATVSKTVDECATHSRGSMDTKKQKWLAGFQITYVGKSKPTALIELHPYEEMYA